MFETSVNDYALVQQYKKQGLHPIAFSVAPTIYRLMPNVTDLTVFLQEGYRGMNFAILDGSEHYHKPTDDFEHLGKDTAYHYLLTARVYADMAANMDLTQLDANEDGMYFTFLPGNLVLMTVTAARIITAVLMILSIVWIAWTLKRGKSNVPKAVRFLRHSIWYPLIVLAIVWVIMPSLLGIYGIAVFSILASALCYELTSSLKTGLAIRAFLYALCGFSLFIVCVPLMAILYMALFLPSLVVIIPIGILLLLYLFFAGAGIRCLE